MQKKYKWMFVGAVLSLIGPLGEWVVLHQVPEGTLPPIMISYIYTETITFVAFCLFGYLLGSYAQKVEKLAFIDTMTGAASRHYLLDRLDDMINLNARYGESFSLIMFDLDHFKKVNDDYGHVIGDQTLRAFASAVMRLKRKSDLFGRYGGEEFILLCPRTEAHEAANLAERIRHGAEKLKERDLGYPGPQTVSAGVYEMMPGIRMSTEELIEMVDKALYDAKVQGRNRVVTRKALKES